MRGAAVAACSAWMAFSVAVLAVASLWYVHAPPRSPEAYRERAVETAEALRSHVQTARIWVRAVRDGDVTREAASVGLRELEADANAAASKFEGYDPPSGARDVRADVTALSSDATEALARLRIARVTQWGPGKVRISGTGDDLPRLAEVMRRDEG